jgi:hypothetical protein
VQAWLEAHPSFELAWLPRYCPKANPIERAFGDVHDKCTRNHQRKRLRDLVGDVLRHLQLNGPWLYELPEIYYTPPDHTSRGRVPNRSTITGRMSVPMLVVSI